MDKILIIEDNKDLNLMLVKTLKTAGYETFSAYTGTDGISEAKNKAYDLILLDIMLPYKSGDEILKEIRTFSDVPVIVMSAKDMVGTKIDILKLGADDYVTKPFDLGEIEARIATNLRRFRKQEKAGNVIEFKDIILDANSKQVRINGTEIDLTAKEYSIIELLMKNKNMIFSKANIYETIWSEEYLGDDSSVKSHLSHLRTKLKNANQEEEYIETVWGLGYRLALK